MSHYPQARFLTSAAEASQLLPDDAAEVAVVGRSNAGKSSAINAIVGRRQFARTSRTPGRTQLVNFFELSSGRRLVDLPGYGFARVPDHVRAGWDRLIGGYLQDRKGLRGLMVVVDVRRGLREGDYQVIELAESFELPLHLLLNKADKLKRGQAKTTLLTVQKELDGRAGVQLFSSLNKSGADEARAVLDAWLER